MTCACLAAARRAAALVSRQAHVPSSIGYFQPVFKREIYEFKAYLFPQISILPSVTLGLPFPQARSKILFSSGFAFGILSNAKSTILTKTGKTSKSSFFCVNVK